MQVWYDESQGPERKSARSPDEGMTFGFQTMKGRTTTISDYEDDPKIKKYINFKVILDNCMI